MNFNYDIINTKPRIILFLFFLFFYKIYYICCEKFNNIIIFKNIFLTHILKKKRIR